MRYLTATNSSASCLMSNRNFWWKKQYPLLKRSRCINTGENLHSVDFILGINKCIIFKHKSAGNIVAIIKWCLPRNEWLQISFIVKYLLQNILLGLEEQRSKRGRVRDYILAAAKPNWQSDMTYNNSQKTTPMSHAPEPRRQIWSRGIFKAMQIRPKWYMLKTWHFGRSCQKCFFIDCQASWEAGANHISHSWIWFHMLIPFYAVK